MSEKCLLIKMKDKRNFLTPEKNLNTLIEFAKTFHAEIYSVIPDPSEKVMGLKSIISAVCTSEYDRQPTCKEIKRVFPAIHRDRTSILLEARKIRNFIKQQLLQGKPVSLKELKDKYKSQKLTDACLCNHMAVARKGLAKDGHAFEKTGAGTYCIKQ